MTAVVLPMRPREPDDDDDDPLEDEQLEVFAEWLVDWAMRQREREGVR